MDSDLFTNVWRIKINAGKITAIYFLEKTKKSNFPQVNPNFIG